MLTELDAFYLDHRRCGELDAGVDGQFVWFSCCCGARIIRRPSRRGNLHERVDVPHRNLPCTHCGAECLCSEYVVEQYAGRKVTRWCETCRRLFDVQMPAKDRVA